MAVLTTPLPGYAAHIACMVMDELGGLKWDASMCLSESLVFAGLWSLCTSVAGLTETEWASRGHSGDDWMH